MQIFYLALREGLCDGVPKPTFLVCRRRANKANTRGLQVVKNLSKLGDGSRPEEQATVSTVSYAHNLLYVERLVVVGHVNFFFYNFQAQIYTVIVFNLNILIVTYCLSHTSADFSKKPTLS